MVVILSYFAAGRMIASLRAVLARRPLGAGLEGLQIVRALPHGHVLAVLGTARRLNKLDRLLPRPMDRRNRLAWG